jgi:hypothetical protein
MLVAVATGRSVLGVGVIVRVAVVVVPVVVRVRMTMIVPMPMMIVRAQVLLAALGLERARDRRYAAALAARQLGEGGIVLDVDRIGVELSRDMPLAEMPGQAHESRRVFRADLEEPLRRGFHLHQAAVLQLHRIAVVERRRLVQIELEFEPAMSPESDVAALTGLVVEPGRIGDPAGLDGGFADDGGGAQHEVSDVVSRQGYHEPVLGIEAQGSCGGLAPPFCKSSIEMPSGERMKAMLPSRGGRLMVTPASINLRQVA